MAAKNGAIKLVAGNSNPALAKAIADYLKTPLTKAVVRRFADMEIFVEIQENVRGADCLRDPVDLVSGQRPPDGIADHHRRAAPLLGAPHHRGDPLFRLRPAGPQAGPAHADLGQARRQPDHPRRRRPRHDARPARRADPGLLRYPDRQPLCLAGDGARHPGALQARQRHGGVARRRRRGARARPCQAHQRAARHHRQAPRARRRIRGDERDRRRRRLHLRAGRRHRRFRRHAGQRRRGAARAEGARRSTPISATACCRAARSPASPSRGSRNWSSPTRSSRPRKCSAPATSACWKSPR